MMMMIITINKQNVGKYFVQGQIIDQPLFVRFANALCALKCAREAQNAQKSSVELCALIATTTTTRANNELQQSEREL